MNIRELTTKQKLLSVLIAALAVATIIFGTIRYANAQAAKRLEESASFVDYRTSRISGTILQEAKELFDADKKGYLVKGLTAEQIDAVQKKLDDAGSSLPEHNEKIADKLAQLQKKQQEVQIWIDLAKNHLEQQEQVNGLFLEQDGKPVINGTEVASEPVIDGKTTIEMINQIGTIERTVINDYNDANWAKDMESLLANATEQATQIATAKKALEAVYQDDQVVAEPTEEAYQQAQTEVDKIKNETVKNELNAILAQVRAALDTWGTDLDEPEFAQTEEAEPAADGLANQDTAEQTPIYQEESPVYNDYTNNDVTDPPANNSGTDNTAPSADSNETETPSSADPNTPSDIDTSNEAEPPTE